MKGIPERLVLAAIILSCGFATQIGSAAKGVALRAKSAQERSHTPASWLPSDRHLKTIATLSLSRNH